MFVLGAGPAGTMAALTLARVGVACRLLERNTAATDKVCGEFLSPEAVARLTELDFPWALAQAGTIRQVRVEAVGRAVTMPLPFEARSVSRSFLDDWMLNFAERAGVQVQRGVYVRDVTPMSDHYELRTTGGSFAAQTLVLATGKHAMARLHPRQPARGPSVVGWKMNFHNMGSQLQQALHETLGLLFFAGGYGGVSRVAKDALTVSLLVQPHLLAGHAADGVSFLQALAPRLPLLSLVLAESMPVWDRAKTVANLPYGHCDKANQAQRGLFVVGDQFAVLPSFTGTGISFAMASGALAARHVATSSPSSSYAQEARVMARKVLRRALPLHRLLQRPTFAHVAMAALGFVPNLLPFIAKGTRVHEPKFVKGLV